MKRIVKSQLDTLAKSPWPMARAGLLATALSFVGITGALADVSEGEEALARGDYETARQQFNAAVQEGDPEGSYQLGQLFLDGLGVAANMTEALKWFICAEAGGGATGLKAQAMRLRTAGEMSDQDVVVAEQLAADCVANALAPAEASDVSSSTLKSFWGEWTVAEGEEPEEFKGSKVDPLAYEPQRYNGVTSVFFAPAEATLEVAKDVALAVGASRVASSFYSVKLEGNKLVLGLLAIFWWFLLFRVVYFLKEQLLDQDGGSSIDGDYRNKKLDRNLHE